MLKWFDIWEQKYLAEMETTLKHNQSICMKYYFFFVLVELVINEDIQTSKIM